MIGVSLTDSGVELLGQRRGLDAYVANGKTMGIPILYPWANRLGANTYTAEGTTVTLTPGRHGVRADPNGLPIHGVLAAYPRWRVTAESADELTVELDFGADPELLASFPFPHLLAVTVRLADPSLDGAHRGNPDWRSGGAAVFRFPPVSSAARFVAGGVDHRRPRHSGSCASTGGDCPPARRRRQPAMTEPLGDKAFDDGYDEVADGAVFAVSGGGRRIEVHFDEGYPAAQIFAPPGEDVVCFEPMTAPTDALRRGGYRSARPGGSAVAVFSIRVA